MNRQLDSNRRIILFKELQSIANIFCSKGSSSDLQSLDVLGLNHFLQPAQTHPHFPYRTTASLIAGVDTYTKDIITQ